MKLYTMGYGLLTGTHEERKRAFQDRLRGIQKRLDKKLIIIDVRKFGSGSRNGRAFAHPGNGDNLGYGIEATVLDLGIDFFYQPKSAFANDFGRTQAGFDRYRNWRRLVRNSGGSALNDYVRRFVREIKDGADCNARVLLCGCRNAYKYNPEKWKCRGAINCHRVVLAEELLKELGKGWEVEHL